MFRMWGKLIKDTKVVRDTVVSITDYSLSRTAMVFSSIDEICRSFDLETPIWLDIRVDEFKRLDRTRFGQDSFIEQIDFDYLEIQVIEE